MITKISKENANIKRKDNILCFTPYGPLKYEYCIISFHVCKMLGSHGHGRCQLTSRALHACEQRAVIKKSNIAKPCFDIPLIDCFTAHQHAFADVKTTGPLLMHLLPVTRASISASAMH